VSKAERIRSRQDLARLPFTTKDDLRDNYPFGLLAVPMREVVRVHASSGTTGRPTVVAYTRTDINLWSDLGISCNVRLVGPREVARSDGKAVRVVDGRTL